MKYDISDLELVWKKGDGEMPEELKHVVNAAKEEKFLRSLELPDDITDTIRDNAHKNNITITEYISSLVIASFQPA